MGERDLFASHFAEAAKNTDTAVVDAEAPSSTFPRENVPKAKHGSKAQIQHDAVAKLIDGGMKMGPASEQVGMQLGVKPGTIVNAYYRVRNAGGATSKPGRKSKKSASSNLGSRLTKIQKKRQNLMDQLSDLDTEQANLLASHADEIDAAVSRSGEIEEMVKRIGKIVGS